MTQTHELVPIEPTALQVRAGQLGVTTTCAKAIYDAMLASAPEVGEAVDMDENTAKRFRGILYLLGKRDEEIERLQSYKQGLNEVIAWMEERGLYHDADYFDEGADFAAILTEHEQQVSACTERQLKADKALLVEALRKAQPACILASDFKYDDGDEDAAQEWNMISVSVSALIAEMEAKK